MYFNKSEHQSKTKGVILKAATLTLFFIAFASSANADTVAKCKVYEFAEMQTMNKKELLELYCTNEKVLGSIKTTITWNEDRKLQELREAVESYKQRDLSAGKLHDEWVKKHGETISKYTEYRSVCETENKRITRLINKIDKNEVAPSCQ